MPAEAQEIELEADLDEGTGDYLVDISTLQAVGTYGIRFAVDGQTFTDDALDLAIYSPPSVVTVRPGCGPAGERTEVCVALDTYVKTDCAAIRLRPWNAAAGTDLPPIPVTVTPAAGAGALVRLEVEPEHLVDGPGEYAIELALNGIDYAQTSRTFRAHASLEIEALSPSIGAAQGGTIVSVLGKGFFSTDECAVIIRAGAKGIVVPAKHNPERGSLDVVMPPRDIDADGAWVPAPSPSPRAHAALPTCSRVYPRRARMPIPTRR